MLESEAQVSDRSQIWAEKAGCRGSVAALAARWAQAGTAGEGCPEPDEKKQDCQEILGLLRI